MTDGIYETVKRAHEKNPTYFLSQYIAHNETREKAYNDFLPGVDQNYLNLIKKRDEMMTGSMVNLGGSPIQDELTKIYATWEAKRKRKEITLKDQLLQIHAEYQTKINTWKETTMIPQGWTFPADGNTAIPPANFGE